MSKAFTKETENENDTENIDTGGAVENESEYTNRPKKREDGCAGAPLLALLLLFRRKKK